MRVRHGATSEIRTHYLALTKGVHILMRFGSMELLAVLTPQPVAYKATALRLSYRSVLSGP